METPKSSTSSSQEGTTSKRKRPNTISPDTVTPLESKRVSVCGHCKKKGTTKGPLSEVIQCDMCYSWVHTACEGLKRSNTNNSHN